MSPNQWGPPTWIFIHTLAHKIKEDSFSIISQQLIQQIQQICYNLPCPECCQHAHQFWSKVKCSNIVTKNDLTNLLFVFHNTVNKRKAYKPFRYDSLAIYKNSQLIESYNRFVKVFNTKGNMSLLIESFHRKMMLAQLRKWLMTNLHHFNITPT